MRLLSLFLAAASIGLCCGLCIFDNKKGWFLDCGLRDNFLFRIKDLGGIRANFDFGLGLGDSDGFPNAIQKTSYKHPNHHRRSDKDNQRQYIPSDQTSRSFTEGPNVFRRRTQNGLRRSGVRRSEGGMRAPALMMTPPAQRRQSFSSPNIIQEIPGRGNQPTIIITQEPPRTRPTPALAPNLPTIGPSFGQLLNLDSNTVADTDHVPSFAAKMFVVRDAPVEFHPPGYEAPEIFSNVEQRVEVPRTKFFCEEQKYLPGIYADIQLGCKVFHLCVPASMGNSMTSFMCPNMTLFDQSIMQCNYWYHVNCEGAEKHYDANLPMAISYRKINAAQLPLTAVRNMNNVALLSQNAQDWAEGSPLLLNNIASKRMGEVEPEGDELYIHGDGIQRNPRMMVQDMEKNEEVTLIEAPSEGK